jgi:drug/metabolite transporter (DMT)-like permease
MTEHTTLFFLLSLAAGVGYSLHNVLLVPFARSMDGLSITVYRNLSFLITLSPLLFLAGFDGIGDTLLYWPYLIGAGITGASGYLFLLESQKYIPVGIATVIASTMPLFLLLWGFFFLGETITRVAFFFVLIIFLGVCLIASVKNRSMPHLDKRTTLGFLYAFFFTILASLSYFFMSFTASNANPFAAGYFWEISVGFSAIVLVILRKIMFQKKFTILTPKKSLQIALRSTPILFASGMIPLAMSMGPPGIAQSLSNASGIILSVTLSILIFKEYLRITQYIAMGIIIAGVFGLRMVS